MAIMTFLEVRNELLNGTPTQFCVYAELLEDMLEEGGFKTLRECLTAKVAKGGCGLELSKVKDMLYFNPMYRHKADTLAVKLQLELIEPLKPVGAPIGHQGVNEYTDKSANVDNINISKTTSKGGTSVEYLLSRLKRDRPDLIEKLANGELKSPRQAALEAGIVKVKYQIEATPEAVVAFIRRHRITLTDQQKSQIF